MTEISKTISYPRELFRRLGDEDIEQDQRLCIFFCPFKPEFEVVFTKALEPACKKYKIHSLFLNKPQAPGIIINDILRAIWIAGIIVVDISGRNPNVMYELGMCHVVKRVHEVVVISR